MLEDVTGGNMQRLFRLIRYLSMPQRLFSFQLITNNRLKTMIGLVFAGFIATASCQAAPKLGISDDGREIQLNEDGTWTYLNEDRLATTVDGKRIRLKSDGRWQEVKEAEAKKFKLVQKGGFSHDQILIDESGLNITLKQVTIESMRTSAHKGDRIKSQILFELQLSLSATAVDHPVTMTDFSAFEVTDNRGRIYPIFDISPQSATLTANKPQPIILKASGAPRWWGTKSMSLTIKPGVLSLQAPVTLVKVMAEVTQKDVTKLTE